MGIMVFIKLRQQNDEIFHREYISYGTQHVCLHYQCIQKFTDYQYFINNYNIITIDNCSPPWFPHCNWPCWASMTAGSTCARSALTSCCFTSMTLVCSIRAVWMSWDITFLASASCWSLTYNETHNIINSSSQSPQLKTNFYANVCCMFQIPKVKTTFNSLHLPNSFIVHAYVIH